MKKSDLIYEGSYIFDTAENSIVAYVGMENDITIPKTICEREVKNSGRNCLKALRD